MRNLVKLRAFAEKKARIAKKDIPDKLDLGLIHDTHSNSSNNNNGSARNGTSDSGMANNGDIDPMVS